MRPFQRIRRVAALVALAGLFCLPSGCGSGVAVNPSTDVALNFQPVTSQAVFQATLPRRSGPGYVPGQVIVKFRPGANGNALLQSLGARVLTTIGNNDTQLLQLASGDAARVAADLGRQVAVEFAEPNYVYRLDLTPPSAGFINQRNYLTEIKLPQAWNLTLGGETVVSAVIDTGVDMAHPDLVKNLIPGYNVLTKGSTPPLDDNGHGTHVAGIIAAGLDSKGSGAVVGVAPRSRVMPIKALDNQGDGNTADIASGILWAADHGARIINLSLGGSGHSRLLNLVIRYALARKVTVVAAMGNGDENGSGEGKNVMRYPAAYDGVIAVGALSGDQRAPFSDWGNWISVSAPGVGIYSTTPTFPVTLSEPDAGSGWPGLRSGHDYLQGTSMASPLVSGVVALMLSRQPQLTPAVIKNKLESTATDAGPPGRDDQVGAGRVNAFLAVQ